MALKKTDFLALFQVIDDKQRKIYQFLQSEPDLRSTIQEKSWIEWTYNSNALEGNTLSLGGTAFFFA